MPSAATRRARRGARGRPARKAVLAAAAAALAVVAASAIDAWRTPGNAGFTARWADWLRSHHAAAVISPLERWYYESQAPAPGGTPRALNAVPSPTAGNAAASGTARLTPPAPVRLVVRPALAGEGRWQPSGALVDGRPALYVAQFRADSRYTSQITSAVWMDPSVLRIRLVPGTREPGGTWRQAPDLTGAAAAHAVAAFNGGFRFQDAQGGFYLDGRSAVPLRAGAASVVLYGSGRVDIGAWGSEVQMTSHVRAVLQNLVPLVDHGRVASDATYRDTHVWGATLGATAVVARSGIGVTAAGALVYVAGPALTARTLAEALQRAGAVRAMTLDMNPEWVTFNFFHPTGRSPRSPVAGTKLYPQMQRPADRYLGPTQEARDFFTVSTR